MAVARIKTYLTYMNQMDYLTADGAVFSLTPAGVDESVLAWTRAAIASHQELIKIGWKEGAASRKNVYFDASRAMALFSEPINSENETAVRP